MNTIIIIYINSLLDMARGSGLSKQGMYLYSKWLVVLAQGALVYTVSSLPIAGGFVLGRALMLSIGTGKPMQAMYGNIKAAKEREFLPFDFIVRIFQRNIETEADARRAGTIFAMLVSLAFYPAFIIMAWLLDNPYILAMGVFLPVYGLLLAALRYLPNEKTRWRWAEGVGMAFILSLYLGAYNL